MVSLGKKSTDLRLRCFLEVKEHLEVVAKVST